MDRKRRVIVMGGVMWGLCCGGDGWLSPSGLRAIPSRAQGRLAATDYENSPSPFELRKVHDSLYWLNDWRLPYPVYHFETGDVDGDGREDAMVGVIKSTRFYPEQGRRLFIFKQVDNSRQPGGPKKVRPLWLGSRLGGRLEDFRYIEGGHIRSLETTDRGQYVVADYRWGGFGMTFDHFIVKGTDKESALILFNQ